MQPERQNCRVRTCVGCEGGADGGGQVREEQARVRPSAGATITGEVLYRMTYTRAVVREILRFRPPAPMVPQVGRPALPIPSNPTLRGCGGKRVLAACLSAH